MNRPAEISPIKFPIERIRTQFPALSQGDSSPIYLDNPAGTLVPAPVIHAAAQAMATASHNLGGFFAGSKRAEAIWEKAHAGMADMLGSQTAREIIIGQSMTSLTFQLSRSIGRNFKPGDEIIVTRMDHEGNISPWLMLAQDLGLEIKWLDFNRETWRIEQQDLQALLTSRTKLLALNYASNLTGSVNDVAALVALARANGTLTYVDGVQFMPHRLPDVQSLGSDFFVCSAYKFFGPHLGVLWGREELLLSLQPYKCRCSSDGLPERFETGTPQTELLAALSATVDYVEWLGEVNGHLGSRREKLLGAYESFERYENTLMYQLIDGLLEIPGLNLQGISDSQVMHNRVPTVSFTHSTHSTHKIAEALSNNNIYAWSGHNYALEPTRLLNLDEDEGVVRLGIAHYNTEAEIDRTLAVIRHII